MPEHSFTLILDGDVEAHLDELFEAGCDDATFGYVDGVPYGDFHRAAPTLVDAIASAISAVESIHGLRVARVEPDNLVTARDCGTSRPDARERATPHCRHARSGNLPSTGLSPAPAQSSLALV